MVCAPASCSRQGYRMLRAHDVSSLVALLTLPLPDTSYATSGVECALSEVNCSRIILDGVTGTQAMEVCAHVASFSCEGAWRCATTAAQSGPLPLAALWSDGHFTAGFGRSWLNTSFNLSNSTDAHGCNGLAAGYSWCAALQAFGRPWETVCADAPPVPPSALARCASGSALTSLQMTKGHSLEDEALLLARPAVSATISNLVCEAVRGALESSARPSRAATLAFDAAPRSEGQVRLGAELAFGSLGLLVLASLATLACFCRQRERRRRERRTRYASLLRRYADDEWGYSTGLQMRPSSYV